MTGAAGNCGLMHGEAAIMELWDRGIRDYAEIGRETGYCEDYVERVVARYNISELSLSSFDRMTVAGSASLLRALHKFHPETLEGRHP